MNIAVLSDCYLPAINGVVTSITQQLEVLRELGHQVDLYCPQYSQESQEEQDLYRLWARPFPFHKREQMTFPWPPAVVRRLWTEPYDLFHIQTPFSVGLIGLAAAFTRRIPRVFHHHTLWEEYVDYLPIPKQVTRAGSIGLCRGLANRCQAVVAPSAQVRDRFADQGVVSPIAVIPTGIRPGLFQNGERRGEYEEGTEVCLYMGRLAHEKSLDALLRVFQRAHQARSQTRLWLVGDGPARQSLEQQVRELGLGEVATFFGFVDRSTLKDFVASARAFIFTSLTETQGLVLLEAQSGGLPVVAFEASGVNEAVQPGQTGYLVPSGEEELMAQKLVELLSHEEQWEQFSTQARIWAQDFSLDKMGQALVSVYEKAREAR